MFELLAKARNQGNNFVDAEEVALPFGCANQHGRVQYLRGPGHTLQSNKIRHIEMADCDSPALSLLECYHSRSAQAYLSSNNVSFHEITRGKGQTITPLRFFARSAVWAGVPIYIRAGKALRESATEIIVDFKRPPLESFAEVIPPASGYMRMRISPDVNIAMGLRVKQPGERMEGRDVELILTEQVAAFRPPYQRLLGDAMRCIGDLFGRHDIVDAQWRIVEKVLDNAPPPIAYEQGSWGPEEANRLISAGGPWHDPQPIALRS